MERTLVPVCYQGKTNLHLGHVIVYLIDHGWEPKGLAPSGKSHVWVMHADSNAPIEIFMPVHAGFIDAGLRVTEAIEIVAAVEIRTTEEVVQDIKAWAIKQTSSGLKPPGTQSEDAGGQAKDA
jgi:hypothetical protein